MKKQSTDLRDSHKIAAHDSSLAQRPPGEQHRIDPLYS
jgi:hypothetical protein